MDRQNWYAGQLVDVPDMDLIETNAHNAIANLTKLLNNNGIVSGMGLVATTPPSLIVNLPSGTICLGDGTIVATTATRTFDSTALVPGPGVNLTVFLFAVPFQNSDTPVVIPTGETENYRLFDDFTLQAQLTPDGGFATQGGVCLGSWILNPGQTQIPQSDINTVNFVSLWTTFAEVNQTLLTLSGDISSINNELGVLTGQMTAVIASVNRITELTGVPYAANLVLDASVQSQFDITLTGNVNSMVINGVSNGQRLLFMIVQDGVGGHTLAWPANFRNTANINTGPNSVNTVEYIVRSFDGFIYPISDISVYNAA